MRSLKLTEPILWELGRFCILVSWMGDGRILAAVCLDFDATFPLFIELYANASLSSSSESVVSSSIAFLRSCLMVVASQQFPVGSAWLSFIGAEARFVRTGGDISLVRLESGLDSCIPAASSIFRRFEGPCSAMMASALLRRCPREDASIKREVVTKRCFKCAIETMKFSGLLANIHFLEVDVWFRRIQVVEQRFRATVTFRKTIWSKSCEVY